MHCALDAAAARGRFVARARAHHGGEVPAGLRPVVERMERGDFDWAEFDPLDLDVPRLRVDTSDGYAPGLDEVARFCWTAG